MVNQQSTDFRSLYRQWAASHRPADAAFRFNDREVTCGELQADVDRHVRRLLELGVGPGTGVGYTLPNCPEVMTLFLAVCRVGAYAIPLFPMIPDQVKVGIFTAGRAKIVITSTRQEGALSAAAAQQHAAFTVVTIESFGIGTDAAPMDDAALAPVFPPMPAMAAASSGTTGVPKTVMLTRLNIASSIRCAADMARSEKGDVYPDHSSVAAFPLSTSGILVCTGLLFAGVVLIFSDDMSPKKFMELVGHWNARSMSAPPSFFEAILALPDIDRYNRSTVTGIMTGMDFFSPRLMARLKEKFPAITSLANGYGLVETSTVFMVKHADDINNWSADTNAFRLDPSSGNEVTLRDATGNPVQPGAEGELWVRGPSVVKEYAGNPQATAASFSEGWFKTGDVARQISETSVELLGRNKYLIKRGGKSVSPLSVQEQVDKVDGVVESAVVGVPHPLYGQMIWVFVVARGETAGLEKLIRMQCRNELPNYMAPDMVRFIERIPKNPGVGKLDVEKLIAMAAGELENITGGSNG
jgi:acyl-CoA synthetase (AMP-forming)/AMP-acid ligase II